MPESHAMPPEEPSGKSLLDKPLHQLTEDGIAQLTREDCRRYLKEKGMRRPSWNKSQAIQQVIMLKKLLEADSEADSRKRPTTSHSRNAAITESVSKGTSRDAKVSVSAEETRPHHVKDLNKPKSSGGFSGRFASAKDESAQPRTTDTINIAAGQMTILYGGKVNVYDDMPADKAQAIMHIAVSPLEFPEEQLNDATLLQPLPCLYKAVSTKARHDSADVILPTLQTASMRDNNSLALGEENIMLLEGTPVSKAVEGPSTRKASVQRYLEKRKDRFKSKRKEGMNSCASLDMYFNHQMGNQIPKIEMCSPTQTRQPSTPARCSSVDNDSIKNV